MGIYDFDKIVNRENTNCVKWDFRTNCSEKATQDALPFWIADMDFECSKPIIDELHKIVDHKIFGYSSHKSDEYYDAVCNWYKRRFNWEINKDDIFYCSGVVPAISFLIRILTDEGDGIIIQEPVYGKFKAKIESNNRIVVNNSLIYENNTYKMDYDDLEEKATENKNKVLILCSPHNPVGRVWKNEELEKVIKICKKHNVWIIADEIHSDLTRKNRIHIPLETVCKDYRDKIITCTSTSKSFNIAGMQIANIIINNKEVQEKWINELSNFGIVSPNPFAIGAVIAAYNNSEDWLDELNEYLDGNMDFVKSYIDEHLPRVKFIYPEGTYLAWLDFNDYNFSSDELEDLMMKEAKVLLDEGYIFGTEGIGFERINVACSRYLLKECMDRIKKNLDIYMKNNI
ncbi:MAG: MalY/PatB family protein [Romboutsia sp.]